MKKGIILVCMVTVLLAAGCGGKPSVVGQTYKLTTDGGNTLVLTFETTTVTQFVKSIDPTTASYPYSLTGDTVTIYPQAGDEGGESEDLKLTDGGKVLTGSDDASYHRQ